MKERPLPPLRTSPPDIGQTIIAASGWGRGGGGKAAGHSPDGSQEWRNWIIRREPGGQAVGYVQATVADDGRQAEIAWVVGVDWQGQGYAAEAAQALVAWLDSRGVTTIRAHIHPGHAASAAVARRAGLAPTGHVGEGEQLWQRDQPG